MRRISYARGKGKLRHNNREIISPNVDRARIGDNITLKRQSLADAYEEIFGDAVAEYNAKQKRADRKISDYFEKLFGVKADEMRADTVLQDKDKRQSFYEYVVGVGRMEDTGYASNPDAAKVSVECLKEYMAGFTARNPQSHVFNAVIHQDEATPHLHYDMIPYADGMKKGMTRQQGINKALEQMDMVQARLQSPTLRNRSEKFSVKFAKPMALKSPRKPKAEGTHTPARSTDRQLIKIGLKSLNRKKQNLKIKQKSRRKIR